MHYLDEILNSSSGVNKQAIYQSIHYQKRSYGVLPKIEEQVPRFVELL
jgi:hypothetical protein